MKVSLSVVFFFFFLNFLDTFYKEESLILLPGRGRCCKKVNAEGYKLGCACLGS